MDLFYYYCGMSYNSEEALAKGVESVRNRLENNPTDYVKVERVTPDGNGGWIMEGVYLSDSGILNLEEGQYYSLSSGITGENLLGITKEEVEAKVLECRKAYARSMAVHVVEASKTFAPTNIDMTVYVNG